MSEQKIEAFWRDATAEDVVKVMKGEQLQARFRDKCVPYWTEHYLCGVNGRHWIAGNFRWDLCQVYDPPAWWLNKPDPGEGYRILHPDERVEKGDEYYSSANNMWLLSGSPDTCNCKQGNFPYRRRIEPVEPTPSNCVAYETQVGEVIQLPNGKRFKVTKQGFEVL